MNIVWCFVAGYSSDSEQLYRHSHAVSTDSLSSRQSNKTDIIATPRMSRHRLKNAALLRDRKQREASKERQVSEKENKEQRAEAKNTSMEIHLPVRENKKNKEKRYSVRSFDPEVDSQGEFTYDGGSESSLRAQVVQDSEKEGERNKNNSTENIDRKISVTDSDMSVDSLECLDLSSKEIQEKKKKKKRKIRKRVEEKISSKEDVVSSPSSVSQLPQLALPEDFQDSSIENSDVTTEEQDKAFSTNSTLGTRILTDVAQRIVSDIVRSALKKCGKPTPNEPDNLDTMGASVQSESSIKRDVIEGTSLEAAGIELEIIEDNSEVDKLKAGELLLAADSVTDGKETVVPEASNDEKKECKRLKNDENSVVSLDETQQEIARITEKKKENSNGSQPADGDGYDAAGVNVEMKDEQIPQDSNLVQGSLGLIKATEESNDRDDKSSLEVKEPLDPQTRCPTEILVTDGTKCNEPRTKHPTLEPEVTTPNDESQSTTMSESMEKNTQDNTVNDSSILLSDGRTSERQDSTPPIRLYDTHVNITNRIINSVSQVLHLQTQYATPTPSSYLSFDPDIPLAYYTTPERGFEGLLNQEFTPNNQRVLEGSQPAHTQEHTGNKKEQSRRHLTDRKTEETFQRFVQGQRFGSPDGRGPAASGMDDLQDPDSGASTSYINTSRGSDSHKGYCYFVVGSADSTSDALQNSDQDSNQPRVSTDVDQTDLDTAPVRLEPRGRRHGERPKSGIYHRSISLYERKRWITAIQEPDLLKTVRQRPSSADARTRASRNNKCMSCPVLSEVSRWTLSCSVWCNTS